MDQSYHTTMATSVTPNPYLPAIGRVLELLRSRWSGIPLSISLRELASAAECGQSAIPGIIKRLADDGYIERLAGFGYLIVVCADTDHDSDRSLMPQSDLNHDRLGKADEGAPSPHPTPNPGACGTASEIDHDHDRSTAAWKKHDHDQQQQPGAHTRVYQKRPIYHDLIAAGAAESVAEQIIAKHPELTIAEFEALRSAAKRRGGARTPDNIGLVFWCLLNDEPLYAPKEPTHERPQRQAAPHRGQRPARSEARQQPPPLTPEYLQSRPRRGDRLRGGGDLPGSGSAADG